MGRKVDLRELQVPLLNLIGSKDHLAPRDASMALEWLVGSEDCTTLEFDLGHIGMYISARAQQEVPVDCSLARDALKHARLHIDAPVDVDLLASDVVTVSREKQHRLRDLFRRSEASHRNAREDLRAYLLWHLG